MIRVEHRRQELTSVGRDRCQNGLPLVVVHRVKRSSQCSPVAFRQGFAGKFLSGLKVCLRSGAIASRWSWGVGCCYRLCGRIDLFRSTVGVADACQLLQHREPA